MDISIPQTPRAWELYDMPGAGKVARELGARVARFARKLETTKLPDIETVLWEYVKDMDKRMSKYRDYGAAGSEPRYQMNYVTRKILAQYLGMGRAEELI